MRMRSSSVGLTYAGVLFLASTSGCSPHGDADEPEIGTPGTAGGCDGAPAVLATPFGDTHRVLPLGKRTFEGKEYSIVTAMPWNYLASHEQCSKAFPMREFSTHYVVDSHFELPYIRGAMDDVAWTPGASNLGWAI